MCPGLWNHCPHCKQRRAESAQEPDPLQPPEKCTGFPGAPTVGTAVTPSPSPPSRLIGLSLPPARWARSDVLAPAWRGPVGVRHPAAGGARRGVPGCYLRLPASAPWREVPSLACAGSPRLEIPLSPEAPPPCFTDADGSPAVYMVSVELMLRGTLSLWALLLGFAALGPGTVARGHITPSLLLLPHCLGLPSHEDPVTAGGQYRCPPLPRPQGLCLVRSHARNSRDLGGASAGTTFLFLTKHCGMAWAPPGGLNSVPPGVCYAHRAPIFSLVLRRSCFPQDLWQCRAAPPTTGSRGGGVERSRTVSSVNPGNTDVSTRPADDRGTLAATPRTPPSCTLLHLIRPTPLIVLSIKIFLHSL